MNDEAVNWHPVPESTNSIYAILSHILGADNFWVRQVICGEAVQRDREADFHAAGNLTDLLTRWEKAWDKIESILGKLDDPQLLEARSLPFRPERKESITIQWLIQHLITHHATHLGHIQLTRHLREQQHRK